MIRITIVHEIDLVCSTLASVLREEPDLEVVGLAARAEDALVTMQHDECDVLLLNVSRPCHSLLRFIHETSNKKTKMKVLVVGIPKTEEFILQCFQAGAAGYVLRDDSLETLKQKIRAAYRGETFVSPRIAGALVSRVAQLSEFANNQGQDQCDLSMLRADLTRREHEVLRHIERGRSNQEIAEALTIEVGTVKNHVHNILKKLNVDNRKRAAMLARQILSEHQNDAVPAVMAQAPQLRYSNSLHRHTLEHAAM